MIKLLYTFTARVPELVPDDLVLDKRSDKVAWVANRKVSGAAAGVDYE